MNTHQLMIASENKDSGFKPLMKTFKNCSLDMGHDNSKRSQRLDNANDHKENQVHVGHGYSEHTEGSEHLQDENQSIYEEPIINVAHLGAQIPVARQDLPVFVVLNKRINLSADEKQSFPDCVLLENKLVFTDINNTRLVIFNEDDSDISYISLSYKPWGITGVSSDIVAVSYPWVRIIQIINICTGSVKFQQNYRNECWGLSYYEHLLYFISSSAILKICDIKGNMKDKFRLPSCDVSYVTVSDDRLFCTDRDILYCCDMLGSIIWEFKVERLKGLHGVTVDGTGNVYVAGEWSNNVVAVSPNGKRCRVILTSADGIDAPRGIYFDKNENRLIVCNCNGNTVLVLNSKNDKLMG
ncbi:unnamed protein product [Mytilus coruscus]|uniref:TRIM2_3 n=1 Tax=Mytilus coruscus TaxID=42192 RepID=A0A6J8ERM7_MYTCO|nr:unnamed protein product [Mytilus coruscus]